eukprot:192015-Pleurochrysis_carterae.AAC.1
MQSGTHARSRGVHATMRPRAHALPDAPALARAGAGCHPQKERSRTQTPSAFTSAAAHGRSAYGRSAYGRSAYGRSACG